MKYVFVELPAFERHRAAYLDDDRFHELQRWLIADPEHGDLVPGTGGLRKLRFADPRRGKGRRGGLRILYFHWSDGRQIWLFTLFDKDEMADLAPRERAALRTLVKKELLARRSR